MKWFWRVILAAGVMLSGMPAAVGTARTPAGANAPNTGLIERVSVASDGSQGDDWSQHAAISAEGRFVAFRSEATNLVEGDMNDWMDIFVRDRLNGTTERISVASDETEGNYNSYYPSISADGRFVAFHSQASNLVYVDTNEATDVFVRDRTAGTTERISVSSEEIQAAGSSGLPAISADGRFVAFTSNAANLVGGDTNRGEDVFVRDRENGTTERVSVASDGSQGNGSSGDASITPDGRYVAFASVAANLVVGDSNQYMDVFVRDRLSETTVRVSLASDGNQTNYFSHTPAISADGRFVAFLSEATNLVSGDTNHAQDVFVHDLWTRTTERVSISNDASQANDYCYSYNPAISGDGRFVSFSSIAPNLVSGDNNGQDVFVRDRLLGTTRRISETAEGIGGNGSSDMPRLSTDLRWVSFTSDASNLVDGDTNQAFDIFVRSMDVYTLFFPQVQADEVGGTPPLER